jgi:hypothetical protein
MKTPGRFSAAFSLPESRLDESPVLVHEADSCLDLVLSG